MVLYSQIYFLTMGYVMVAAVAALLAAGVLSLLHKNKRLHLIISSAILLVILVSSLTLSAYNQSFIVLNLFIVYPFSMFFTALFSMALLLVNMLASEYSTDYLSFSMLLGFSALGIFAIAMANSLITILLGLELITVPTALMIMLSGKKFIEAAMKLFVLGAVAVAAFAFAVSLTLPYGPQFALTPLSSNASVSSGYLIVLALLLFIAALSFDASLFPFNLWVPDVYTGAPGYVTAMMAGINKKVAFVALFEILIVVMYSLSGYFSSAFQVIAVLTMFFGNLVAMVQVNIKRLFAYSSIAQAGFIALGIATATQYGIEASIFQIAAHTFMIIGTFAIVLWLESKNIKTIQDYNGLNYRNSFAAFALTIFMLSMIGVPPLVGFVGKFLLFTSIIQVGFILLTALAVINSFISVYYYAKVIMSMYSKRDKERMDATWSINTTIAICLGFVIVMGLFPQSLMSASALASGSLLLIR